MTARIRTDAKALADDVRQHLTGEAPGSPLVLAPIAGPGVLEPLRRLVVAEYRAHPVELVAYGTLLARFPHPPAAELWVTLARIVHEATPKLREVARALGMTETDLVGRPADGGTYSFHGAMSWVATSGSQAAAALAAHTDMQVYYSGATAVARRLRQEGAPVPREFLDYYDDPGDSTLAELALTVAQDGLDRGDNPQEALFYAHHIADALLTVWKETVTHSKGDDR
ncbi:hypothetical protein [Streptomyces alfalfae]|uniref:Uncharacterized protein n=1 Tax=Streptomyces alfalfae TaxID=1642299 RepID=A0A7T4PLT3_9ACTN|nr:hypothetical protein [Streptomyces alfalfae]QQC92663.1 hypothetical protein I8755_33030 [Streptomyces alfalfae]QUI34707.1 hypothetical protein H9W91_30505 [Streptomyces alfalfae]